MDPLLARTLSVLALSSFLVALVALLIVLTRPLAAALRSVVSSLTAIVADGFLSLVIVGLPLAIGTLRSFVTFPATSATFPFPLH